jgi:hypothetical protein
VQLHAQAGQGRFQRGQQLAVVQLALAGQVHALLEAALQCGLHGGHLGVADAFQRWQAGVDAAVLLEQAAQAAGIGCILAVPDHSVPFCWKNTGASSWAISSGQRLSPCWPMRTTPGSVMADSASGASMAAATRAAAPSPSGPWASRGRCGDRAGQGQGQQAAHEAAAQNGDL